jgi:hypothetical protein
MRRIDEVGMGDGSMTEGTRIWKKGRQMAFAALLVVVALLLFCLFYFGSRI